jgi:FlaA1/EpsC-like NDP-sugar epimerase
MTLRYAVPGSVLQIPVGVLVVEFLFSFTGAAGGRVTRRILYEIRAKRLNGSQATRVLLIGAGRAGVNIANQLRSAANLRPVAFLDDDPKKLGLVVAGLNVLGPVSALSDIASRQKVEQIIVCVASPPRELLRHVWAVAELLGISAKIVPTVEDILKRNVNSSSFRTVEMNDLLGRKPIHPCIDDQAVKIAYAGSASSSRPRVARSVPNWLSRFLKLDPAHCCFSIRMKMGSTTPTRALIRLPEPRRLP